jgi:ABC-2 type transport system permease protein
MTGTVRIIAGFVKKELQQALRDRVMRLLVFGVPVFQLTLFGYAISTEFRNIKLSVVYEPQDYLARQMESHFYGSRWFLPAPVDTADPEHLLRSGKADAVLIMPRQGLTKAVGRSEATMQLLIDASNATKARAVDRYVRSVVAAFFAARATSASAQPVAFDVRVLYNPTLQTSYFMVPGIMTMLICVVTILLTGMSIAKEKELGTFESIISAPLTNLQIILGKTVPFIILGIVDACIVIVAGVVIFGVPLRGPFLLLLLASLVFVSTTVSVGTLISTFAANQQQAMMGSFMFLFPAMLLSGVMFPIENMPQAIRFIADINPLRYFASIMRNVMLKSANLELVLPQLGILALIAAIIIFITLRRFHQTLN